MKEIAPRDRIFMLVAGDLIALAVITILGFATHGELRTAGVRVLTTFIPLVVGWAAVGPLMGVYQPETIEKPSRFWLPFWAMVVGAPLAAWLRGVLLQSNIVPIFVVVLGGIAALSILFWRVIYYFLSVRRRLS